MNQRFLAPLWLGVLIVSGQALAAGVSVQVNSQSGPLEGALVMFDPLDESPPPAHGAASIDQVSKQFVPRISIIRTGTSVTFPNSDNIRHQVYSFSKAKTFNLKLYSGTQAAPVVFDKPGLVVLGCNIHDRMVAFVGVVDSPYFAKTDAAGRVNIDLPPARYSLKVWHPNLTAPVPTQQLTLPLNTPLQPLNVSLDMNSAAVAAWPE